MTSTFRFSAITHGFFAFVFSIGAAIVLTCVSSSQSFAITLTAQGGGGGPSCIPSVVGYNLTGSTPVAGSANCSDTSASFGATGAALSDASAGHVGATANVATIGSAAGANMQGTAIYSDLFIFHSSNPTQTSTTISLNLNALGTMAVGGPFAVASVDLQASFNGSLVGEITSSKNTTAPATCSSTFGGGAGCTGAIFSGGNVTTQSVLVGLGTSVLVQLRLDASVSSSAGGSSASSEFSNSLDFLIGSALFNLPDGVTVDAPDSFVFNNIFAPPTSATPLPAALPLFAGGLGVIGLLARRRTRKQAA